MTRKSKYRYSPFHSKSQSFHPNRVKNKNEVLTITSEHPYSEDKFERKFQDMISPYNQSFEQPEEELIEFNGKQHMDTNKLSSEHIENNMVALTS